MSLNRNRPYGEIWGGSVPARFVQDGRFFDQAGEEVQLEPHQYDAADPETTAAPAAAPAATPTAMLAPAVNGAELAILAQRNKLLMHAIALLEHAQAEVISDLPDHDVDLLEVMAEVEAIAKQRKTVLEALAVEIRDKKEQEARDAEANQLPEDKTDQLGAQLEG